MPLADGLAKLLELIIFLSDLMHSLDQVFDSFGANSGYARELYQNYLIDPSSVPSAWAKFFDKLEPSEGPLPHVYKGNGNGVQHHTGAAVVGLDAALAQRVALLVEGYRNEGHLRAHINPLSQGTHNPEATPSFVQFSAAELEQDVPWANFAGGSKGKLRDLVLALQSAYCDSIGFEFSHLLSAEEKSWLLQRVEAGRPKGCFDSSRRKRLLKRLIEAEGLESELHKTYVGAKRFSVQGGETLLPILDCVIERGASCGLKHVVIGMAHRGRLNVLTHIAGKPYEILFAEFEDESIAAVVGAGDVKYHLGYSSAFKTAAGADVQVELTPNPSHLEFVNPVVEGVVRARQDIEHNKQRAAVMPILIHGDAAFIGQGISWETLNFAGVEGFNTGGTVHVVVNNQVGFTACPLESRTSVYCTDMAKAIQAPVFHVNGEDVEACCWVSELATEFRQVFGKDVVIDLYCYRRYGHNEGDDPTFTQPLMYAEVQGKKTLPDLYSSFLQSQGVLEDGEYDKLREEFSTRFQAARKAKKPLAQGPACAVHGMLRPPAPETAVPAERLERIAKTFVEFPANFKPHPKLAKILEKRLEAVRAGSGIDWGLAEALSFGALILEGVNVRLSGQDSGRGTFSQRHLLLRDHSTQQAYSPYSQLAEEGAASFEVYNSVLSEAGVMGFEFGYSTVARKSLVLWEGQFGDFANGAQVIIDQFLSSSEAKWGELSGLVLMLPHGFEGQGPEHSSARLERYLQLSAENNWTVAYPSSAAQQFHLLRRHALVDIKRPLVIMTPKSLLRLPQAACALNELSAGRFAPVLVNDFAKSGQAQSVVICAGRVYYDIAAALEKAKKQVRVLRIEQLYPFPAKDILAQIPKSAKRVVWVQEEPRNMGAWSYIEPLLRGECELRSTYIGRPASASPATGSHKRSGHELSEFLAQMVEAV